MPMRTTLDIDDPILKDLRKLQKAEGKSLGRLVSDLLAQALGNRTSGHRRPAPFRWVSKNMASRVDLADHDALLTALDEDAA